MLSVATLFWEDRVELIGRDGLGQIPGFTHTQRLLWSFQSSDKSRLRMEYIFLNVQ
jgi:hypothetical protein